MMPLVPIVYNTHFVVINCNSKLLKLLEPFCDKIFVDCFFENYLKDEQKNTMYNLSNKIYSIEDKNDDFNVRLNIDGNKLNDKIFNEIIINLPIIIDHSGEKNGKFEIDTFEVEINIPEGFITNVPIRPVFSNIF